MREVCVIRNETPMIEAIRTPLLEFRYEIRRVLFRKWNSRSSVKIATRRLNGMLITKANTPVRQHRGVNERKALSMGNYTTRLQLNAQILAGIGEITPFERAIEAQVEQAREARRFELDLRDQRRLSHVFGTDQVGIAQTLAVHALNHR